MVNPVRNWTITANNDLGGDYPTQWKRACFQIIDTMRNAGWTVVQSSNGSVANTSDNITTESDWVQNTTGSGGSWAVLESPSGWLPNSGTLRVLLYANVSSGDTTPNPLHYYFSSDPYNTDGTTTSLPTPTGFQTSVTSDEVCSWTNYVPATYVAGYTDRGDIFFLGKQNGQNFISNMWVLGSNVDGDGGGRGDLRFYFLAMGSNGSIITKPNLEQTSNWRSLRRDGLAQESQNKAAAILWELAGSWSNGLDDFGDLNMQAIHIGENHPGSDGRYKGQWIDFFAVPEQATFGTLDDSESGQTYRRVVVGSGLAMYLPTASLPLT